MDEVKDSDFFFQVLSKIDVVKLFILQLLLFQEFYDDKAEQEY